MGKKKRALTRARRAELRHKVEENRAREKKWDRHRQEMDRNMEDAIALAMQRPPENSTTAQIRKMLDREMFTHDATVDAEAGADIRFRRLLSVVADRRPRLLYEPYVRLVKALPRIRFFRPIEDWHPPGKGSGRALRSLAQHVLGPYETPPFLFESLLLNRMDTPRIKLQLDVACKIATGCSMYKDVRGDLLPLPLTRKMCHLLLRTPSHLTLLQGVRRAQVLGLGGGEKLALQLGQGFFGGFRMYERFWTEAIHWLCRQPDIDLEQVDPVCDYLHAMREESRDFNLKGRSWTSVKRAMRCWHEDLAMAAELRNRNRRGGKQGSSRFKSAGLNAGHWHDNIKKHGQLVEQKVWYIREILNVDDLIQEGRNMGHCVASYDRSIRKGASSIWTLTCNQKRKVTIEVRNATSSIVQARGRFNRLPLPDEIQKIRLWADDNWLTINCFGF